MASTTTDPRDVHTGDVTPERELAYELLGQESGLWTEILYELLGQPQRYSELKPLLGDQADNTLTYALEKLVDEGLVERTSDVVDDELVKRYAISRKGIDVFLHVHLLETIGGFVATSGSAAVDVRSTLERERVRSKEVPYVMLLSSPEGDRREGSTYHVRPTDERTWSLKREGAQRATKRFDQPRLAVARGLELAGENGKVFVHDREGGIETVLETSTRETVLPG